MQINKHIKEVMFNMITAIGRAYSKCYMRVEDGTTQVILNGKLKRR